MHIYVIIPVFNRQEYTRLCLQSLHQQDVQGFTIIVVDDGSTDNTSEMIREQFPEVICLLGDGNLWWVGSINMGIRHALTLGQPDDYILVINDDLTVPSNYISSLINAAAQKPKAIIGSVETLQTSPSIIKNGGTRVNWKIAKGKKINRGLPLDQFAEGTLVKVDRLTGRGTLFPSVVFREAGLYDEVHFRQCGDPELPLRANFKYGYPLFISYDAVVISYPGKGKSVNDKKNYTLSDFHEYFFGIRSHFNIKDKYWIAHNIAPNKFWFIRYYAFNLMRIIGRYLTRLRLRPAKG